MTTFRLVFMAAAATGMLLMFPAGAQDKAVTPSGPVLAVYHPESDQGSAVTAVEAYVFGRPRDFQRYEGRRDFYRGDSGLFDRNRRSRGWQGYDRFVYTTDRYGRLWRFDRYTRQWNLMPNYSWRYQHPYRDYPPIYGRPLTPKYRSDHGRGDWRDRDWGDRNRHGRNGRSERRSNRH